MIDTCSVLPTTSYQQSDNLHSDIPGTSHISVYSQEGDAVSMTSTISSAFGSMICGSRTGILFNNSMSLFSHPSNSSTNLPKPAVSPLSGTSPLLMMDDSGHVLLVLGGSGGSRTITASVQVVVSHLWMMKSLHSAICAPRLHVDLHPLTIYHDVDFVEDILETLKRYGHEHLQAITGKYPYLAVEHGVSIQRNKRNEASDDRHHPELPHVLSAMDWRKK